MKVLKRGKSQPWVGKKVKCECRCTFLLREADKRKVTLIRDEGGDHSIGGKDTYHVKCPTCKEDISFTFESIKKAGPRGFIKAA